MDQKMIEVRFKYNFSNPSHRQVTDARNLGWKKKEGFCIHDVLLFTAIVIQYRQFYSPVHAAIAAWHKINLQEAVEKDFNVNVSKVSVFSDSGTGRQETDILDPQLDEAGRRAVLNGMSSGDYVGVDYSLKAYATADHRSWV